MSNIIFLSQMPTIPRRLSRLLKNTLPSSFSVFPWNTEYENDNTQGCCFFGNTLSAFDYLINVICNTLLCIWLPNLVFPTFYPPSFPTLKNFRASMLKFILSSPSHIIVNVRHNTEYFFWINSFKSILCKSSLRVYMY